MTAFRTLFTPSLNWLLVCVPAALVLRYAAPESQTILFIIS